MGDLEELGAERNFLLGGVTFTGQRTWETGYRPSSDSPEALGTLISAV